MLGCDEGDEVEPQFIGDHDLCELENAELGRRFERDDAAGDRARG
jgi:hypothetical protein